MMTIAKAVSFFLGPVFVLLPIPYILVERFSQNSFYALKWTIFSYAFILSVAVFVLMGVRFGIFTNFDVSRREQRPLLFAFCAIAVLLYLLSLLILDGPKVLFVFLFAIILGLAAIVIANRRIKASIHMATLTSAALFMGIVYGGYYLLFLLLIPFLAWSRIKTKEHTFAETVAGSLLGALVTLIVYTVSKQSLSGAV